MPPVPSVISAKFEDLVAVGLRRPDRRGSEPRAGRDATCPMDEVEDGDREARAGGGAAQLRHAAARRRRSSSSTRPTRRRASWCSPTARPRPSATRCSPSAPPPACRRRPRRATSINAIHLASRGMHVLPRSAAAGGGEALRRRGLGPADPARGRGARAAPGRRDQRADRAPALDRRSRPCARTRATSTASSASPRAASSACAPGRRGRDERAR